MTNNDTSPALSERSSVFVLYTTNEYDSYDRNATILGVFTTREKAENPYNI